jgi:hypothetical protein
MGRSYPQMISRKQELMLRIMEIVTQNVATQEERSIWDVIRSRSRYPELELIHYLPRCLVNPDFANTDIYWLTCQGNMFVRRGVKAPDYDEVSNCIKELFRLVPDSFQDLLDHQRAKYLRRLRIESL